MNINKVNLNIELEDGSISTIQLPTPIIVKPPVFEPPVVVPPTPPALPKKYVMLNATLTWKGALSQLQISDASEVTLFVFSVTSKGVINTTTITSEAAFVKAVKDAGKKATFSVAGGAQNIADITAAVTTNKTAFINNIAARITQYGYDGVTLDIENTNINPNDMVTFVNALRVKLDSIKPGLIMGMYTQPYQLSSVFAKIDQAAHSLTWISAMIYDFDYTIDQLVARTKEWLPKVGNDKSKLICGISVNYNDAVRPGNRLTTAEYAQVLDIVIAEGWKGIGIWENALFTQPWVDVQRSKITV